MHSEKVECGIRNNSQSMLFNKNKSKLSLVKSIEFNPTPRFQDEILQLVMPVVPFNSDEEE